MWLRWLLLLATLGVAAGFGLGLVLFADRLGFAGGPVPASTLLSDLATHGIVLRGEWLVLACLALLFVLLAAVGRKP
ncbi:hypothetical protein HRbin40_00800 [bacterium HR40]|nr:hypothetical protein HRbin40_00800 [bacterium HR40]